MVGWHQREYKWSTILTPDKSTSTTPLQRLPITLLQLFVGQQGKLINSCVYPLKTSPASQAMSHALETQLFVKLCSSTFWFCNSAVLFSF